MSIAAIVTGGYGSFGGISAVAKQGFSSYVGLAEPPLAGKQYITLTSINSLSHLAGTAAAVGEVETCDLFASLTTALLQDSGYSISITANGVVTINSGGDQGRLFFGRDLYRPSVSAYDTTIQGTIVVNNLPPVSTAYWPSALAAITLVRNVAMTPIDFTPGFSDPESDAFVVTFESVPTAPVITASQTGQTSISVALTTASTNASSGTPGIDFAANVLSGTPTAAIGSYSTSVRATDAFGEYTNEAQQIHIVGSALSALTGTLSISGAADLDARGKLQAAGSLSISGAANVGLLGALSVSGTLSITGAADLFFPVINEAPFWAGGNNKVFRFTVGTGTDTIDFAPYWTDPENDPIVDYQLDISESVPAGWSLDAATGVLTVAIDTPSSHTGWRMTAEDDQGGTGLSAQFDILVVAVTVVTFRFEQS